LELPQVVRERPVECLLSRREEHWEVGEPGARIRLVHDLSHYGETVRIDGTLDLQPDREPSGPIEELTRRGAGGPDARQGRLAEAVEDQGNTAGGPLDEARGPVDPELSLHASEDVVGRLVRGFLAGHAEYRGPHGERLCAPVATSGQ